MEFAGPNRRDAKRPHVLPVLGPTGREPKVGRRRPGESERLEQLHHQEPPQPEVGPIHFKRKVVDQAQAGLAEKSLELPRIQKPNLPVGAVLPKKTRIPPPNIAVKQAKPGGIAARKETYVLRRDIDDSAS